MNRKRRQDLPALVTTVFFLVPIAHHIRELLCATVQDLHGRFSKFNDQNEAESKDYAVMTAIFPTL